MHTYISIHNWKLQEHTNVLCVPFALDLATMAPKLGLIKVSFLPHYQCNMAST